MPAATAPPLPTFHIHIRTTAAGVPMYDVKWNHRTALGGKRQVLRRLGPAHVTGDAEAGWQPAPGRARPGVLTRSAAHTAAAVVVATVEEELAAAESEVEEPEGMPTFRVAAAGYLQRLESTGNAKPSTLRDHRYTLAEPGQPHKRGSGTCPGLIMQALGDLPIDEITPKQINTLLAKIETTATGTRKKPPGPRTVNKMRAVISAVFGYACSPTTYSLDRNPAERTDRRREPLKQRLKYYRVAEVEHLAEVMASGSWRTPPKYPVGDLEQEWRDWEDQRDADAIRLSAYCGLRRGEILPLRVGDIFLELHKLVVQRAVSDNVETSPKTHRSREVPLPPIAITVLRRLLTTPDPAGHLMVSPDAYVLRNRDGQRLDGSALRKRYVAAQEDSGLRRLRWHDLRHTYGSLLAADNVDLVSIKEVLGHRDGRTTERYTHARSAEELAARVGEAFSREYPGGAPGVESLLKDLTPEQLAAIADIVRGPAVKPGEQPLSATQN